MTPPPRYPTRPEIPTTGSGAAHRAEVHRNTGRYSFTMPEGAQTFGAQTLGSQTLGSQTQRHDSAVVVQRDDYFDMDDTPLPVTLPDIGRGRDKAPPKSFLVALSVIMGVLLAIGTIIGVMGKAFYVQRDEYTAKTLHDAEQDTATQQTLLRLGNALDRQEAAFNRLSETVQGIQIVVGGLRPASRSR